MWRYQRPGFGALLLAELQRQQQCSLFCDTVLRADGVSVPAHSSVLSALSPKLSSALSSSPPPPAGQRHLLEFKTVGSCTLLQMVRLLYCGEMVGEGERERQEAVSAAAKLGVHGLVEVRKRDGEDGEEEGGQQREVGVQTEPLKREENGVRWGKWRREVRDGSTLLWKEALSDGERDTWTQTEELEMSAARPPHPAASFQTVDVTAIQSSAEPDSHLLPHHIPYVPVSLLYPPDGDQASAHHRPSSVLMAPTEESTAAGHTPVFVLPPSYSSVILPSLPSSHVSAAASSQVTQVLPPFAADPQSWWAGTADGGEGEGFEQFQGNIPGFISHFLNPGQEEGSGRRRRAGRQRGGGAGGARRAGTGERRARRPRARTGGGGRGRGAARIAGAGGAVVRWGVQASRTGKGGGTVSRKLYLKTRELLQPIKICLKRRGRGKGWEVSRDGEALPPGEGAGGQTQRGRKRNATQQLTQDGVPVTKTQRVRAKSVSYSSPPLPLYNMQTYELPLNPPVPSASIQPSPSPNLLSPPASYVAPAPALLHTTSLPPRGPPPQEDQSEQFERLLEEVMMGLDILPNNSNSALHPHPHHHPPAHSTSGTSCTYPSSGNAFVQTEQGQRCCTTDLQEAGSDLHGSIETVAVAARADGSSSVKGEVLIQQPQEEGELSKILDHFLRSFEQQVATCSAGVEMDGQSYTQASQPQPYTVLREYNETPTQTTTPHTSHAEHTHSPHPPQAVTPCAHTPNPAVYTQTPPLLSPLTNTAQAPPVSAARPRSRHMVVNKREEKEDRILTRSQWRERMGSPEEVSAVKLTELLEREKSHPKSPPSHTQPCKASTTGAVSSVPTSSLETTFPHEQPKAPGEVRRPSRQLSKRRKSRRRFSVRKPVGTSDTKTDSVCDEGGKVAQWPQQMPVVTLERSVPLPGAETDVTSQEFKCPSLEAKSPTKTETAKTSPPSAKYPLKSLPDKDHPVKRIRKSYPIRSRIKEAHITIGDAEDQLKKRRRDSSRATVSPSLPQPVQHCGRDEERETNGDRQKAKRVCLEHVAPTTSEPRAPCSASAPSVSKPKIKLEETDQNGDERGNLTDEEESGSEDLIVVDGASDETSGLEEGEGDRREAKPAMSPPSHPAVEVNPGSTGSWEKEEEEEEVDVVGGSSPFPEPLPISWTDVSESEEEEEEIDVIGGEVDYASSASLLSSLL